ERLFGVHDVPHDSLRDPPFRRVGQLAGALEDAGRGLVPHDAFGGSAIWLGLVLSHRQAVGWRVRVFRHDDGFAIAARDEEQALADRRRAEVAGAVLLVVDGVAEVFERLLPALERAALAAWTRHGVLFGR